MSKLNIFNEYKGLRKELYVLFFGRIMTNMGAMIWPVFSLILSLKLGYNAFQIAIYMAAVSILGIPLSLLGGKLADKLNKKNIIIICDVVSILSFLYCSFSEINDTTILIFVIASFFQNIEWPSYDALVADFTTSKDREKAYSLSYLGNNIGLMLSPTIAGFLFKDHLNLSFLINGIAILISTIFIFFFVKNIEKEKDDSIESIYEKEVDNKISGFKFIFSNKVILLYIIVIMFNSFVYGMWTYLMPYDLGDTYGENGAALQGTMTSLNCIIVVVFTGIFTTFFKKIRDVDKMKLGEGLIILGYLIFLLFVNNIVMCYVCIFLFTFGEIFNTLASSPFLTRRIPSTHRGRIISISNVIANVFASLMQLFVGFLRDNTSGGRVFSWLFVMAFGLIEITFIFILKRFDKEKYPILYSNN